MPSLVTRIVSLATLPTQVAARLPELVDAMIRMPGEMERASREVRHTRQELEEAQTRLDRLIQLSEVAIGEMQAGNANMQEGTARLEKFTPLVETAINDMETGISELREALQRFRELSSAMDDIPMVDTDTT